MLQTVKVYRNILHTINRRKVNYIGHISRRNCRLKQRYRETKVTGRSSKRRKQLVDDLKEKKGYWSLQEVVLDRTLRELALEEVMKIS